MMWAFGDARDRGAGASAGWRRHAVEEGAMSSQGSRLSRRRFLGTSVAAAIGGVSSGLFGARAEAGQRPTPALPLAELHPSGMVDEAYWWKVRSQFNIVDGLAFMNNGTQGPMPRVVLEKNERILREIAEDPSDNYRRDDINDVRAKVAPFVGADPEEIALTRSTSEGMNIFAHGLDWREGDEALMNSHEHGGGRGPYLSLMERRGININVIDIPAPPESQEQIVDLYEQAITPRTRAIMVSHITYVTGLMTPIKLLSEMAHRHGVLVSVDGAHPLGMLDLDFHAMGCDHYSGAGQKWLLAGGGTGVCYVKRDVQDQVWPLMGGPPREGATANRYESVGQRNVPSLLGMGDAVDLQDTIGKRNIEERDRQLSSRLRAGLQEIPGVHLWTSTDRGLSAGLTLFSVHDIPMGNVVRALFDEFRVHIRTMGTGNLNGVRASTHFYNMPHEVDRLLEGVRHIAANSGNYMTTAA
ncbi:MAG TPA: hypothetical protein DCP38_00625 [Acidobacteria bacterium]|nr:hypothetical protein [Acidobacteriota bacterium]